jgi:hypothetical protein
MNYHLLTKKLNLPTDFSPPTKLNYEDVVAVAITRSTLTADVAAVEQLLQL